MLLKSHDRHAHIFLHDRILESGCTESFTKFNYLEMEQKVEFRLVNKYISELMTRVYDFDFTVRTA